VETTSHSAVETTTATVTTAAALTARGRGQKAPENDRSND
jgi:hypothetical protein